MPRPIEVLDPDFTEKVRQGVCTTCLRPIGPFRDVLSRKEYHISGMCQDCQDSVFTDDGPVRDDDHPDSYLPDDDWEDDDWN